VACRGREVKGRRRGLREACEPYGEDGAFRSVADVIDAVSLMKVRRYKQEQRALAKTVAVQRPVRQVRNG